MLCNSREREKSVKVVGENAMCKPSRPNTACLSLSTTSTGHATNGSPVRRFSTLPSTPSTMAESTPSEYVTLVSCDGFEFIIPRSAACISGTIRRMLDPSSTWIGDGDCGMRLVLTIRCAIGKFSEAITGRCVLETLTYVFCYPHTSLSFSASSPGSLLNLSLVGLFSRKSANTSFTMRSTRIRSMSQIWIFRPSCVWNS